jgi:hypothetical protein
VYQELWAALSGPVNDEDTLVQVITTRAEVDLQALKSEFMSASKKALGEVISNETGGSFRQFLLTIVHPKDHVVQSRTPRVSNGSQNDSYYSGSAGSSSSNSFQL